jgi:two-component system LytT family response regulator|tara:strand:- start:127 stop:882 length:756 start_codon:yes stop_codon:yes gene_type:complete
MKRVIIVDDEEPALEMMTSLLKRYFSHKFIIVDSCLNISDAEKSIHANSPDLVFLDIRMKNGGGFELLRKLGKVDFDVIFTTAHSEHALEAIKNSALDYLLKPISPAELILSVKKFEDKHKSKFEGDRIDRIELLMDNLNNGDNNFPAISFPVNEGYKLIRSNQIMYCVSEINYTKVHLVEGTSFLVSRTLKKIEELLPHQFFLRSHKSYLVNKNYIKKYMNKEGHFLLLSNDEKIPVSSRKRSEILSSII